MGKSKFNDNEANRNKYVETTVDETGVNEMVVDETGVDKLGCYQCFFSVSSSFCL